MNFVSLVSSVFLAASAFAAPISVGGLYNGVTDIVKGGLSLDLNDGNGIGGGVVDIIKDII